MHYFVGIVFEIVVIIYYCVCLVFIVVVVLAASKCTVMIKPVIVFVVVVPLRIIFSYWVLVLEFMVSNSTDQCVGM